MTAAPLCLTPDPVAWWRRLCPVTPRLLLCGDLHENPRKAVAQLSQWVEEGVTHILDVRGEFTDRPLVAQRAPELVYHWAGVHDHGGRQEPEWFEAGSMLAREALCNPTSRLLVHCHMGINRGPSMALALMLDQGWDCIEALDAIRAARPIAAVIYAPDAIAWWHRRRGSSEEKLEVDLARVTKWFEANQISLREVARLIRHVR